MALGMRLDSVVHHPCLIECLLAQALAGVGEQLMEFVQFRGDGVEAFEQPHVAVKLFDDEGARQRVGMLPGGVQALPDKTDTALPEVALGFALVGLEGDEKWEQGFGIGKELLAAEAVGLRQIG